MKRCIISMMNPNEEVSSNNVCLPVFCKLPPLDLLDVMAPLALGQFLLLSLLTSNLTLSSPPSSTPLTRLLRCSSCLV